MAFGMDQVAGAANGIIGQGMNMLFSGWQDKRQLKQQQKLTDQQIAAQKDLGTFNREQAMKMWKDTNYAAQVAEAKKAGMSISALYGGTGASGATAAGAGAGSVTGGQAGDPNTGVGMGIQMASQLALQKAQKENIEADTENKKAEAANKGIDTEIKTATKEDSIKQIVENANKTMSEAIIKANDQTISDLTMKDQIKQVTEETLSKILGNKEKSQDIKLKEAETAIKEFEANMAKSGLSPNTPWWVKALTELADKYGLNFLK
ncbi:hypothetical protein HDC92_004766 [Pedobacter sp. AK017]|uniref:hypothetical protein n=1 Tax=Pedobacter sp. AK017 TaxID=2723073 RepID=UPI0016217211|nr:hypothetical protein [Pedobacter sp. AK017]MBB5441062.1 hypothetical protein [Pedobacter sp. AK017]